MALIGCAGLALAAGAQAQSFVSITFPAPSGSLPDRTTKYFSLDVSDVYTTSTKYLKTVKFAAGDTNGPLSVYEADSPEAALATDSPSPNFDGTWACASSTETWTIALSGSGAVVYPSIANLRAINPLASADLEVSLESNADSGRVDQGETIVFVTTVRNNGPDDATNVRVDAALDPHLEMVGCSTWDSDYDADEGVWYIGDLIRGDWRQLILTAKAVSVGTVSNVVRVACAETDPVSSNNAARIDDIAVTKPPVPYRDPVAGVTNVCADYSSYTNQTTLTSGWYVVSGAVTNGTRIVVSGDVNLILCDGAELFADRGIHLPDGKSLAIWAQSTDEATMGKLRADARNQWGSSRDAGIGGDGDEHSGYQASIFAACGALTINGGAIEAIGGGYAAAGIGGADNGVGGDVTINDGIVFAAGGNYAAGIGGGSTDGGTVNINGGRVTAVGGIHAAGIGGGSGGSGGVINIAGGTVNATGGCKEDGEGVGAGIGGGDWGSGGTITITGGTVTAAAGNAKGQAIGRGDGPRNSGDLSFDGMKVFASQDDMDAIPDRPVAADLRETFCRTNWVALAVCDPHDYDGDSCRWCGAANPLKRIAASVTGWTAPYDGQGHRVEVLVSDPADGAALRFTLDDPTDPDTVWSESAPMFTNVCDETVWVELSAEGYRTATISAAVTVARAPLAITAKDQTYVYNGRPQGEGDPVYVDPADIAAKVDVAGLAAGDALAGVTMTGHRTEVGVYAGEIHVTGATITNAVGATVTGNYAITFGSGTLTIEEPPPPSVSNVVARQRWPWNGLVDVDYEVVGDTEGLEARISFAEQGGEGRTWVATKFLAGAKPSAKSGRNRATWDAAADGAADVVASNVVATVTLVGPDVWLLPQGYELYNGDIYLDGDKVGSADDVDTDLIVPPNGSCTCLLISPYLDANGETRYRQIDATPAVAVESDEKDMFTTSAAAGEVTVSVNSLVALGASATISCSVRGCTMKNSLKIATASVRNITMYLPAECRPQMYNPDAWDVFVRLIAFADYNTEFAASAASLPCRLAKPDDTLDGMLIGGFTYTLNGHRFDRVNMYKVEASVPDTAHRALLLFELRAKNAATGDYGFVMPAFMIDLDCPLSLENDNLSPDDKKYTEDDYVPYDTDQFQPLWTAEFATNQTKFGSYRKQTAETETNVKTKEFSVGDLIDFIPTRMPGSEGSTTANPKWIINVSDVRPRDAAVIQGDLDHKNMKAVGAGETCILGSWYGVEGIVYPIHFEKLSTSPATYSPEPTPLRVTQ